ncbi:MAG: hypothetical protein IIB39_10560 [Candidatus Marinimicrobia bacterium]|nr:hypothetical protein [Candidatus Neomarinimicrobiota bacterium]
MGDINFAIAQTRAELSGSVSVESRIYQNSPLFPEQHRNYLSAAFNPEYYVEWSDGDQGLIIAPFLRLDQFDSERTHFDIREFIWRLSKRDFDLKIGIGKVFWGVTESQHLVDIINQTDQVESPDGEEKMGQPMINLTIIKDWGFLDLFILPGFRERTFIGNEGRLRFPFIIDTKRSQFEATNENQHIDFAARWTHSINIFDIGLSHFYGTSREPLLVQTGLNNGSPTFSPRYDLINQTGLDLQASLGGWLWKFEGIVRSGQQRQFTALTFGFEYTLVGIMDSDADLGIISEYLYDDRGNDAFTIFENDLFLGARLALNDVQSSALLAGVIFDNDSGSKLLRVEGSRRFGADWVVELEMAGFYGAKPFDLIYAFRKDDYLELKVFKYF